MLGVMSPPANVSTPNRRETILSSGVFILCLLFNIWGVQVGWRNQNLPGHGFRQSQTALSAWQIQQNHDFSVDYATPVLGKPWAIPLEFPLFQWTAVAVSDGTGLGLIKSGRAVSLACFYLTLPAIFLLLGTLGVAQVHRWLVLALVVTSPLYIFYSRAFLIETMALMFGWWFWVAFEKAVVNRSGRWLLLASLAGTGAGLVKVTTLCIYLLPAAGWALRRLWSGRREASWRRDLPWMTAAVAIPFVTTLWWEHHADAIRQQNPLAHFLVSKNLHGFIFGTWETRFSPELWMQKWLTTAYSVTWWPLLAVVPAIALVSTGIRRRQSLAWAGLFLAAPTVFPMLYGIHDYYFMANGVLLLTALGLLLVGVAESTRWHWLPAFLVLLLAGGQASRYCRGYYATQSGLSEGGTGLTQSLRGVVKPDELIVIVGQDWNPMIPFYSQRRAMMLREEELRDPVRLDAAFAALAGEKIGALAISNSVRNPADFLRRTARYGLGTEPTYRWQDVTVYLRHDSRGESVRQIRKNFYPEVKWIPGVEPKPERLAAQWFEVAGLHSPQSEYFSGMNPKPVRFYSSFGPAVETQGGRMDFGAHPVTRLVFALSAGPHVLRTTVTLAPETYASEQHADRMTDGVELTLTALGRDAPGHELYTRLINPRDNLSDRGPCLIEIPFDLDQAGEVELFFGPGPAGRDTHDSILMGRMEIR